MYSRLKRMFPWCYMHSYESNIFKSSTSEQKNGVVCYIIISFKLTIFLLQSVNMIISWISRITMSRLSSLQTCPNIWIPDIIDVIGCFLRVFSYSWRQKEHLGLMTTPYLQLRHSDSFIHHLLLPVTRKYIKYVSSVLHA